MKGQLTEKVDAYSLGVLALEINSGIKGNKFRSKYCLETLLVNISLEKTFT